MTKVDDLFRTKIQTRLVESAQVKEKTAIDCMDSILAAIELIINTFNSGNKILICGNGGSAADSQHMAGEFVCILNKAINRPGLPAIALTTDTSVLTAYANDVHFDKIFQRQIQALGKPNDLLICISTSGNSKNIMEAVEMAKTTNLHTIALTGNHGELQKIVDVAIAIPSTNTQYIQETHIAVEHVLCELVEDFMFAQKKSN